MSAPTKIEWTDFTWNPVSGCTKVGKKTAGRMLDGRTHDEFPGGAS